MTHRDNDDSSWPRGTGGRPRAVFKNPVLGCAALLAGGLAVVLSACSGGSAGTSAPAAGASSPGAYCAGKTITFVSPDAPGAQDDEYMRAAAAGMGKYLHCNVKVTNVPQGDTIPGQDEAAAAAPDGLTIGYLNIATELEAKASDTPGVDFNYLNVGFIGSPPAPYNVMVGSPSSPYATIEDLLKAKQPVSILTVTSGGATSALKALIAAYGIKASLVTGYANSADLVQGFIRGDGPVTDTAENPLQSVVATGKARPILQLGSADTSPYSKVYSELKGVPTLTQLQLEDPPKTANGRKLLQALTAYRSLPQSWLFVPAGTPASIVDQLRKAMQAAFTDAATQKQMNTEGLTSGFISGTEGKQDIDAMAAAVPLLTKYSQSQKS